MLNFLKKADACVSRTVRSVCIVLMAAIFVMFLLNVFVRFVPIYNFTQTDDWIQFCLIWMIFLGAQDLVRTRNHFVVDFLSDRIQNLNIKKILKIIVCLIELTTYIIITWFGIIWVLKSNSYMQSITWMQVRWMYLAIPFSSFFMSLYTIRDLFLVINGKFFEYLD